MLFNSLFRKRNTKDENSVKDTKCSTKRKTNSDKLSTVDSSAHRNGWGSYIFGPAEAHLRRRKRAHYRNMASGINFKKIWQPIKVVVTVAIIVWLVLQVDVQALQASLHWENLEYLLFGSALIVFSLILVQTYRLHILLVDMPFRFVQTMRISLIGLFFNNVLPSNVGGDAIKAHMIKKGGNRSWTEAIAVVGVDRVAGMAVLLLYGMVYASFYSVQGLFQPVFQKAGDLWDNYYLFILGGLFVGAFAFFLARKLLGTIYKKVSDFLKDLWKQLRFYSALVYVKVLLYSFLFQFFRALGLYYFTLYFGVEVGVLDMLFVLFLVTMVALVPISIGSIGVLEGSIAYTLAWFDVPLTIGVSIALIHRILLMLVSLSGGWMYLRNKSELQIEVEKNASSS